VPLDVFSFTYVRLGMTFSYMVSAKEQELVALVILAILGVGFYRLILWLKEATRTADPWGDEIDKTLDQDDAVPLCHHCFTPQQHNGWFCPECGATVGPYCNYLPFVYIFSQGEVLRAGVTERIRHSPLIVIGFVLLSLVMCAVAAPIYWFFLFKHLRQTDPAVAESAPPGA
jgi:hypothetical protein